MAKRLKSRADSDDLHKRNLVKREGNEDISHLRENYDLGHTFL